jgi:hypothetical protein
MKKIKPFKDSLFVVAFHSECACSEIIRGWETVLDYLDGELGYDTVDYTVRDPNNELHDRRHWLTHNCFTEDGDQRLMFSMSEFAYCVGLTILRITHGNYKGTQHDE